MQDEDDVEVTQVSGMIKIAALIRANNSTFRHIHQSMQDTNEEVCILNQ